MKKLFSAIMTLSLCSTVVSSEKPSDQKKEVEKKPHSQQNGTSKMTGNILTSIKTLEKEESLKEKFRDIVKNIWDEYVPKSKL